MEGGENNTGSGVSLFGRDIMSIPCFRKCAMTGISSGFASTLLTFLYTSNPTKSAHIGFWTVIGVTFPYWFICRDRVYDTELQIYQVQQELQKSAKEEYLILDSLEFGPETSG